MRHPKGTVLRTRDHKQSTAMQGEQQNLQPQSTESRSDPVVQANEAKARETKEVMDEGDPLFRIPPETTIAGVLIRNWAGWKINGVKNLL